MIALFIMRMIMELNKRLAATARLAPRYIDIPDRISSTRQDQSLYRPCPDRASLPIGLKSERSHNAFISAYQCT
jgi:hypothetical protein